MKLSITKIYSLLFTLLLGCSSTSQSTPKNDLEKSNLKSNVKSIKQTSFKIKFVGDKIKKGEKHWTLSSDADFTKNFNQKGLITSEYYYNSNDSLIRKIENIYEYDLITEKKINSVKNPPQTGTKIYGDQDERLMLFVYNKGLLTETKIKIKNSAFKSGYFTVTSTKKYNSKKYLIEEINSMGGSIKHTYDDEGNKIQSNAYNRDRQVWKSLKKYKNGNLIEQKFYDFDQYDNLGNKINWDANKYTLDISTYSYDKYGNVKTENDVNKFIYNYDENNNWISKIKYFNKNPIIITEREIVYYD